MEVADFIHAQVVEANSIVTYRMLANKFSLSNTIAQAKLEEMAQTLGLKVLYWVIWKSLKQSSPITLMAQLLDEAQLSTLSSNNELEITGHNAYSLHSSIPLNSDTLLTVIEEEEAKYFEINLNRREPRFQIVQHPNFSIATNPTPSSLRVDPPAPLLVTKNKEVIVKEKVKEEEEKVKESKKKEEVKPVPKTSNLSKRKKNQKEITDDNVEMTVTTTTTTPKETATTTTVNKDWEKKVKIDKKRKIITSDSSDEEMPLEQLFDIPVVKEESTKAPQQNKRRKKLVSKERCFEDDEGFLVTEMVKEWVSEEEPPSTTSPTAATAAAAAPTVAIEASSNAAENRGDGRKVTAAKQRDLTNFFKKK